MPIMLDNISSNTICALHVVKVCLCLGTKQIGWPKCHFSSVQNCQSRPNISSKFRILPKFGPDFERYRYLVCKLIFNSMLRNAAKSVWVGPKASEVCYYAIDLRHLVAQNQWLPALSTRVHLQYITDNLRHGHGPSLGGQMGAIRCL